MENYPSSPRIPCKYFRLGCNASFLDFERLDHEEICNYRPCQCPMSSAPCKWQGTFEQIVPHITQFHQLMVFEGTDTELAVTNFNWPGDVHWIKIQYCFGHHFVVVLTKHDQNDGFKQFYAFVQLIGSQKQADSFIYRLELVGHRRRVMWESTPLTVDHNVHSVISNSECFMFDLGTALLFIRDGTLRLNMSISVVNNTFQ